MNKIAGLVQQRYGETQESVRQKINSFISSGDEPGKLFADVPNPRLHLLQRRGLQFKRSRRAFARRRVDGAEGGGVLRIRLTKQGFHAVNAQRISIRNRRLRR